MRIKLNNTYVFTGYFLLILSLVLVFSNSAQASIAGWAGDKLIQGFGWIIYVIVFTIGKFTSFLLGWLFQVASFNKFIDIDTVIKGWVIVRDLCNMFFILILLIIAFATILRIESYNYKKLLPKLLIMAVLINFSKTICGLFIDFAQVIMLTFVNGIGNGAANLTSLLGMDKMMAYNKEAADKVSGSLGLQTVAGIILALFSALVVLVVIVVMIAILVMRVIMLWIYVILSPIAFLAAAFPAGQKYSSQWWSEFSKQVVVGPVLAFFLWLALMSAQNSSDSLGIEQIETAGLDQGILIGLLEGKTFQTYIITMGLLIGGLMMTQQMGGMAASIAGKGLDWAKKAPMLLGKGSLKVGGWGARKFALFQGFEGSKIDEATGEKKRHFRGFEIRPTKIYEGIKEALADKTKREEGDIQAKAGAELRGGRLLGALGASRDFTEQAARGFLWHNAWTTNENGAVFSTIMARRGNRKLKGLEKEMEDAEKDYNDHPNDDSKFKKIEEIQGKIDKTKEEYGKYKAPYTFYADAKRMEMIGEQSKKLGDNDNEEDLVEKFNDAFRQGNKNLASAIFIHMAKVGHSNEILEMVKALEDVKNSKGETVSSVKNGDTFTADAAGLRGMVNQYFVKGLGMNQQEAYAVQTQFSTLAKKVNHYNLSETVGSKNGFLYQRNDAEQASRAVGEMMKKDVEQLLRQFNRLGHGGESQYKIGEDTKRVANFNQQSESAFFKLAASWHQEVNDRQRFNMNEAQNLYNTYKIEQEIKGIEGVADPNLDLKKAITGPFRSILTAVKDSKNADEKYIDKNGDENTYGQLALETLKYGKDKYEAATYSDLQARIATEKNDAKRKILEAELKKEKAIGKALKKEIEKELEAIPGYAERLKKRQKNKKEKEEGKVGA